MYPIDTIAAIATAGGRGAIGVIRVSGPEAQSIARRMLGELPVQRVATLAPFRGGDGAVLDVGVAIYFEAPASFTGEHVLELQAHGGAMVLDLLMQHLLTLGCRAARPGEFSERAFLNGKMDIAQAEAVADLIDAGSAAAARAAARSLRGEFSSHVGELQTRLTELRKRVEGAIDFPDDDASFAADANLERRFAQIFAAFDTIQAAARQGALLRNGMSVVIAGKPNAGKSSLLNRLAGEEIAIVTAVPGTTRDVLRQTLQLDGLPVNLIDTAGLRTTDDVIEAEGVRRALAEVSKADLVLHVVDTTEGFDATHLAAQPAGVPVIVVFNKIDLAGEAARRDDEALPARIHLSAKTGAGIELLRTHLKAVAGYQGAESGALSARRRHLDGLTRARQFVQRAADGLACTPAIELVAEDLRLAQRELGELTGEFGSDELLGEIFRSFCIGK